METIMNPPQFHTKFSVCFRFEISSFFLYLTIRQNENEGIKKALPAGRRHQLWGSLHQYSPQTNFLAPTPPLYPLCFVWQKALNLPSQTKISPIAQSRIVVFLGCVPTSSFSSPASPCRYSPLP